MNDTDFDAAAWNLIKRGNRNGLAMLYDKYSPVMFRVALRLLKNHSAAEDLLHDVFLEAWQKAGQYNPALGSLRSWMLLRIRSRAMDRIRTSKVALKYATAAKLWAQDQIINVDNAAIETDSQQARSALNQLSLKQKTVVELGYLEGLTCREIAERCSIPIGTVKSRLSAGISAMRRQMISTTEGAS